MALIQKSTTTGVVRCGVFAEFHKRVLASGTSIRPSMPAMIVSSVSSRAKTYLAISHPHTSARVDKIARDGE